MKLYDELVARGLIAQVTNEEEIREMIDNGKATFYIGFDPTADSLHVHQKGFAFYPSDQVGFPYGVGIGAFRRKKLIGIYYGRIHTFRDTILDYTNINILRAALVTLIARHPGDHIHQEEN